MSNLGFFDSAAGGSESDDEKVDVLPAAPLPEPEPLPVAAVEPVKRKRSDAASALPSPDDAFAEVEASQFSFLQPVASQSQAPVAFVGTRTAKSIVVSDAVASQLQAGAGRGLKAIEAAGVTALLSSTPGSSQVLTLSGDDVALRQAELRLAEVCFLKNLCVAFAHCRCVSAGNRCSGVRYDTDHDGKQRASSRAYWQGWREHQKVAGGDGDTR